ERGRHPAYGECRHRRRPGVRGRGAHRHPRRGGVLPTRRHPAVRDAQDARRLSAARHPPSSANRNTLRLSLSSTTTVSSETAMSCTSSLRMSAVPTTLPVPISATETRQTTLVPASLMLISATRLLCAAYPYAVRSPSPTSWRFSPLVRSSTDAPVSWV